ncbi:MAG: 50S ribosomal protein L37ae [Candidatus Parvarchaeota archaeon]|nr:50S ribosomal protein L37ae [Candidatus Jingweiarchaeum tengchongense]MCW1298306.1 50S ribosomal protein L37ae [Candidatus Jingweiarchaeum tengchongense]MCW1300397.1 50S ribosomal protein L37ae [Candidatus Jingweiarchaeum tengchongense]MCW1304758.1 50S ribosomal protein L37ae [Candidatus Jingweiarchaeum tengchongense]MCW1305348.1 50S ribosomal protein L37ae [Candidatus Jingweiarchaeum tengchongense]
MAKTKFVKTTGRFGTRYGLAIRRRVKEVEEKQKKRYLCPNCKKSVLKRISAGIWYCKKCKSKFAGGAYYPEI